jgi:PAS domain S-box-containing protein
MKKFLTKINFLINYNPTGLLIALMVLIFTLYLFKTTRKHIYDFELKRFEYRTSLATYNLKSRMQGYFQILLGVKGMIISSDSITREEWKKYYNSLMVEQNYPGIQGIGLATYLVRGSEYLLERRLKNEGFPEFHIFPPGKRSIYTPIVYIEPFEERNLRAFGFDMFSDSVRRRAMEQARDTGLPTITGKVTLVQETETEVQPGFLLYVPIYKKSLLPNTLQERKNTIKAFAYAPFRSYDLLDNLMYNYDNIGMEVYDGSVASENLLYIKNLDSIQKNEAIFQKVIKLEISGRTWVLRYCSLPSFFSRGVFYPPYFILLGGITITILIFLITLYFAQNQQSNLLKQTITDNASAAIFTINAEGYCTFLNPAAKKMTGYDLQEISVKPLHDLIHNCEATDSNFSNCRLYQAIIEFKEIKDHEDIFLTKDGREFFAACSTKPIIKRGHPTSTLLEVRDITEEKKSKQRLIDTAEQLKTINNDLDNFIYTASHDLRAPIANLEGLMNGLNKTAIVKLDNSEKTMVEMVIMSINRLKRTISDLTTITKAQKDVEKDQERINLKEVLEDVKADLNVLIRESNPEFVEHLKVPFINYSKKDVRSIFYNLLSNAMKYRNPERKLRIEITTENENNFTLLSVKDNGLGIKEEYQKKLFVMFKRIHTHVEGSGIGLYILKRILENKGGKVEVESTEGKGTTFKVFFGRSA